MSADKNRGELLVAFEAYKAQVAKSMIGGGEGNRVRQILDRLSLSDFEAGWQASRAALVIELPVINERDWAVTSDECSAMREGIEIMSRRVEATGCKVSRPPKPSAPERKCPGCGAAGFTANCDQCIPY